MVKISDLLLKRIGETRRGVRFTLQRVKRPSSIKRGSTVSAHKKKHTGFYFPQCNSCLWLCTSPPTTMQPLQHNSTAIESCGQYSLQYKAPATVFLHLSIWKAFSSRLHPVELARGGCGLSKYCVWIVGGGVQI